MEKLKNVLGKSSALIIGLTGGIASGKSTVAHLLEEMGVYTIDFDILARLVVEPGMPAWKKIVDYFGKEILQDNDKIDRKRLSKIVFTDKEKRRLLESFTHPPIAEEFFRHVDETVSNDPEAIIQAVIPLLFESGMQGLFHKIVVIYAPKEKQIERLINRDGISRNEAMNILDSQMPIDEKIEQADFIINNENSVEETKKQVQELWHKLKDLQNRGEGRN